MIAGLQHPRAYRKQIEHFDHPTVYSFTKSIGNGLTHEDEDNAKPFELLSDTPFNGNYLIKLLNVLVMLELLSQISWTLIDNIHFIFDTNLKEIHNPDI